MRKLYFLFAGIIVTAISLSANAGSFTPDVANFNFTIQASNNVNFTNTSTLGNEPGTRRALWTFGDGSSQWTGGLDGVQHHYTSPGTYTACLKIVRINPNTNDSIYSAQVCKTVVIETVCAANFETAATSAYPLGRYFVAQPVHSQNKKPVRICWTFGDNHDTCIQYSTTYTGAYGVYHFYTQPGAYNVCVNILYDGGCEAHNCRPIQIGEPDSCRADFERIPVTTANNPLRLSFMALPWHNQNKKPSRICWTFGDNRDTCINYGQDYNGSYIVNHNYQQAGHYEVCVKILYFGGCEARKCKLVEINRPDSCKADFERIPASSSNILSSSFRALPWHNNNKKPSRICWSFGDGRDTCINYGQDYNGPYTVNHNYQQAGQFEVCVKILYFGGCEARKCKLIIIPQNSCTVNLYEITPTNNSLRRLFYAFASSVPPRPIERICWNFGDGTDSCIMNTASTPPPAFMEHTYPGPGVYHVCVRVVFQGGCVAENCKEVVIRTNSHACGGYMTDSMIAPHTYKFKAFAIHNPNDPVTSYHWTFGDGTAANGPEAVHTYNAPGEYRVCLSIVTQSNCETRVCNSIGVAGTNQPVLHLSPNPVINIVHAQYLSTQNQTVTIKITNSSGVVVRTYTRTAVAGINNWDFDLSALLPGTYLFTVQTASQAVSAVFIKQ